MLNIQQQLSSIRESGFKPNFTAFQNPQKNLLPKYNLEQDLFVKSSLPSTVKQPSVAFMGEKVLSMCLKNAEGQAVEASLFELNPMSVEDNEKIDFVRDNWQQTRILDSLISDFDCCEGRFFSLEIDDPDNPQDKIQALACCNNGELYQQELRYLQGKPDNNYGEDTRKYSQAGRMMLVAMFQQAMDDGFEFVHITSANDDFYDHLEIPPIGERVRTVDREFMEEFIVESEESVNA